MKNFKIERFKIVVDRRVDLIFLESQAQITEMRQPLLSIIIPTLNEEPRLGRLLRSIEIQSFRDFEVLVIDGGSKDKTIEIAQRYKAMAYVKEGWREFPSRNFGAAKANGRILLFLSADVYLPEGILQHLVDVFSVNKVAGVCGMGMPFEAPVWMKMGYFTFWKALIVWSTISKDFHGSTNFMAASKEAFFEVGGFLDEFCADTLFFNALGRRRKVKILATTTVFVSGRRAKKMGFMGFAKHFLWVFVYDYLPILRNTPVTRMLATYSAGYRARHG